ncbi:fatty acid-binding-like protein 5 [Plakobranchus ocellatus]|uniref:Fatty acid-binding-like protein 5 n=1 Tax=Plakobranchus ocellatus TaxID=259542 RepID=A0AAV4E1G3_9GAST|nr:fatty acid-binding-like protein 5 [Plakobranchus ocellatus]
MIEKLLNTQFKSHNEEGLDEYMQAQNVNFILRKIVKNMTIYETLTQDGDTFTYKFETTFKNHKMIFKLGEPFIDYGLDGRNMKTTFTVEDDKLITTQENTKEGDVPCRMERRVLEDGNLEIKLISTPTNTVCKRIFVVNKRL